MEEDTYENILFLVNRGANQSISGDEGPHGRALLVCTLLIMGQVKKNLAFGVVHSTARGMQWFCFPTERWVPVCLQLLSKTLTCSLRIDRSLVY